MLGENTNIGCGTITANYDGYNKHQTLIGDNCFIGPGAKLFGKINIGDNVAIGANSVVNKNFPDNVTIAGIPAKIVSKKGTVNKFSYYVEERDNANE